MTAIINTYISPIRFAQLAGLFGGLLFIILGTIEYPGSKIEYLIFSATYAALLLSGFYRQGSYGYLFLVVFLWLGFWFKLTIHMLLDRPFVEGVGGFYGGDLAWFETNVIPPVTYSYSAELHWDEVLDVAIIAAFGVMAARILWHLLGNKKILGTSGAQTAPIWYHKCRKWLWSLVISIVIALSVANAYWGILLVGLAPQTILAWPINSVISWMVGTGSAMGIATLAWWDVSLRKDVTSTVFAILIEGCISTISLLSRAVYVFHVVPQFIALFIHRTKLGEYSWRWVSLIILLFITSFSISIVSVTELRAQYYSQAKTTIQPKPRPEILLSVALSKVPKNSSNIALFSKLEALNARLAATKDGGEEQKELLEMLRLEKEALEKKLLAQSNDTFQMGKITEITKYHIGNILAIFGDRWVGVEGVMAVSAYQNKGENEFRAVLMEKRQIGTVSIYQKICNSLYQGMDNEKFLFASLPGVAAFLYISGSFLVVFFGVLLLALLLLLSERLVEVLTDNPLLCALFGVSAANAISQFGLSPLQNIPYFFMWFSGVAFIWFIQSTYLISLARRFGLVR